VTADTGPAELDRRGCGRLTADDSLRKDRQQVTPEETDVTAAAQDALLVAEAARHGDVHPQVSAPGPEAHRRGGYAAVGTLSMTIDVTECDGRDQQDANTIAGRAVTRVTERQVFPAPPVADRARVAPLELRIVTRYEKRVKPVLDRVFGLLLCLLLLPVMAAVAVAILVSLGKPVFIRQLRAGRYGQPFTLIKFRTMLPDRRRAGSGLAHGAYAGPDRRLQHKVLTDPRHTPLGRILRKWSLDELPQLFNVVRGDMSLVGPRPELIEIVDRYEPWQRGRHLVKPGITGLWQVSMRGSGIMHEHTDVDLRYVERVTAAGDCRILLATIPAVLGMRPGQ
jgi:lipopolysaccharide/colanic/teichoic acid biosynthesis glycosyltransferase